MDTNKSKPTGLMAAQYPAMVKRLHAGRAAQSGVYGALLAQKRLSGITNILDASSGGYCKTMAADEVIQKYTILAGTVLRPRGVAELHGMALNLEKVSDVRELAKLLSPQMNG